MDEGLAAGFFGKMPSAGDFVQRRLPASFVDPWDGAFAAAVAGSREALGEADWRAAYDAGSVWRFLLAAGACGPKAWCGVLGPGKDRSGRRFPMVIAAPLADAAGAAALTRPDWYEAAERVWRSAQGDDQGDGQSDDQRAPGLTVEQFDQAVAALERIADLPIDPRPAAAENEPGDGQVSRVALPSYACLLGAHLAALWERRAGSTSSVCFWWRDAGQAQAGALLATPGLPDAAAYRVLLESSLVAAGRDSGAPACEAAPTVEAAPAAPAQAIRGSAAVAAGYPVGSGDAVVLTRDGGALRLVAADCGPVPDAQLAATIAGLVDRLSAQGAPPGTGALRDELFKLDRWLRSRASAAGQPAADWAIIAARQSGMHLSLLCTGAAAAWLWRDGGMTRLGADRPPADAPNVGGDFDDLLFGRDYRSTGVATGGLGGGGKPDCVESGHDLRPGDRLLLMATSRLLQLPPATLARGLAQTGPEQACRHIGEAAGLDARQTWPLTAVWVG